MKVEKEFLTQRRWNSVLNTVEVKTSSAYQAQMDNISEWTCGSKAEGIVGGGELEGQHSAYRASLLGRQPGLESTSICPICLVPLCSAQPTQPHMAALTV